MRIFCIADCRGEMIERVLHIMIEITVGERTGELFKISRILKSICVGEYKNK